MAQREAEYGAKGNRGTDDWILKGVLNFYNRELQKSQKTAAHVVLTEENMCELLKDGYCLWVVVENYFPDEELQYVETQTVPWRDTVMARLEGGSNVVKLFEFLSRKGMVIVNIGSSDIIAGHRQLVFSFVFQLSKFLVSTRERIVYYRMRMQEAVWKGDKRVGASKYSLDTVINMFLLVVAGVHERTLRKEQYDVVLLKALAAANLISDEQYVDYVTMRTRESRMRMVYTVFSGVYRQIDVPEHVFVRGDTRLNYLFLSAFMEDYCTPHRFEKCLKQYLKNQKRVCTEKPSGESTENDVVCSLSNIVGPQHEKTSRHTHDVHQSDCVSDTDTLEGILRHAENCSCAEASEAETDRSEADDLTDGVCREASRTEHTADAGENTQEEESCTETADARPGNMQEEESCTETADARRGNTQSLLSQRMRSAADEEMEIETKSIAVSNERCKSCMRLEEEFKNILFDERFYVSSEIAKILEMVNEEIGRKRMCGHPSHTRETDVSSALENLRCVLNYALGKYRKMSLEIQHLNGILRQKEMCETAMKQRIQQYVYQKVREEEDGE